MPRKYCTVTHAEVWTPITGRKSYWRVWLACGQIVNTYREAYDRNGNKTKPPVRMACRKCGG